MHVVSPTAIPATLPDVTDILVAPGYMQLEADTFDTWPRLNAVISPFTGVEGFDVAGFTRRAVLVANGPAEENSICTAEATILLLLAAWYDLAGAAALVVSGETAPLPPRARMLARRTVGVIGYGGIGRRVVDRLATFGVDILVNSRSAPAGLPSGARGRSRHVDHPVGHRVRLCLARCLDAAHAGRGSTGRDETRRTAGEHLTRRPDR